MERYRVNIKQPEGADFWHIVKLRTGGVVPWLQRLIVQAELNTLRERYPLAQVFIYKV